MQVGLRARPEVVRRILIVLYGIAGCGALAMAMLGAAAARLPWFIITMFCFGSLIEALRRERTVPPVQNRATENT